MCSQDSSLHATTAAPCFPALCCSGTGSSGISSGQALQEGSVSYHHRGRFRFEYNVHGERFRLIVTFSGTEEGSVLIVTSMGSVLIATHREGSVLVTYCSSGPF
ncbi:hypothetical protein AVEN_39188-1 [Araneus ventricosus]|uniref:Uncharacterized protein n=1 Tax=Araneus ventricosus TaxID=182803 RepID=A0A4Y2GHD0_ARAVE|nr:hypothetical protein AVEN_39188-1 [Araneus ventricosus]